MNVAQRSRSYNTPAYMTLSHPHHPTPPQPHTQGQRWWEECWKNEESVALLEALTPKTMAMSSKMLASIIQNCAVKVATWAEPFSRLIPLIGVHLRLGQLGIAYFTGAELQDWGSRLQWMLFVYNGICVWALCLFIYCKYMWYNIITYML